MLFSFRFLGICFLLLHSFSFFSIFSGAPAVESSHYSVTGGNPPLSAEGGAGGGASADTSAALGNANSGNDLLTRCCVGPVGRFRPLPRPPRKPTSSGPGPNYIPQNCQMPSGTIRHGRTHWNFDKNLAQIRFNIVNTI